jgi:hypothetical protein
MALAYQKLGEVGEGRRWLKKAGDWLDSIGDGLPANAEESLGLHRHNWLEALILRKQVEAALGKSNGR